MRALIVLLLSAACWSVSGTATVKVVLIVPETMTAGNLVVDGRQQVTLNLDPTVRNGLPAMTDRLVDGNEKPLDKPQVGVVCYRELIVW